MAFFLINHAIAEILERSSAPGKRVPEQDKRWRIISAQSMVLLIISMSLWLLFPSNGISAVDGKRLPAKASAQLSASGYGPELAIDENDSSLWLASLTPHGSNDNNNVWFQLDFGTVKKVARLNWLAASGTPYPASAPSRYKVIVSNDGATWTTVHDATSAVIPTTEGNVLLNTDARYVRLVTTQVNDGTGWALGLREIWVTEGRDKSAISLLWHLRALMFDGRVKLTWQPPNVSGIARLNVYRSESPTNAIGTKIASMGASSHEYSVVVPNWTPYYYWVQAVDSNGREVGISNKAAAFAHPADKASNRAETFSFWYDPYKSATDPDSSNRHIGNATFVVSDKANAITDLAKAGIGMLSYITLYETWEWTAKFNKDQEFAKVVEKIAPIAFFKITANFSGSPPGYVPGKFNRPNSNTFNPKAIQYTVDPNSAEFRNMALAHVRKRLADGVLGFFVDEGYEDDIAASSVCQSTGHTHYYGDNLTSADAFIGMLMEITCAVKKMNPRGVVMVNGGVPADAEFYGLKLGDVDDGQLWESYLRSSYITPKEHADEWATVYRRSVDLEKAWNSAPPRRMFVLSYPMNRNEAFLCYATAKLCDLPWSAGLGASDQHFVTYPELVNIRLGVPTEVRQYGGTKLGEAYIRRYEQGFVVVNPTHQEQKLTLSLAGHKKCHDVFAGKDLTGDNLVVVLPPESGRVYLY